MRRVGGPHARPSDSDGFETSANRGCRCQARGLQTGSGHSKELIMTAVPRVLTLTASAVLLATLAIAQPQTPKQPPLPQDPTPVPAPKPKVFERLSRSLRRRRQAVVWAVTPTRPVGMSAARPGRPARFGVGRSPEQPDRCRLCPARCAAGLEGWHARNDWLSRQGLSDRRGPRYREARRLRGAPGQGGRTRERPVEVFQPNRHRIGSLHESPQRIDWRPDRA